MTDTLRFTLDMTNIETADDGNTTHFGGTYVLDGVERQGHGDDRSDSHRDDIKDHLVARCQDMWPDAGEEESEDVMCEITDVVDEIELEEGFGTIVVTRSGGKFSVTRE